MNDSNGQFAYNGYDYDMASSLTEMDGILLEAGERPAFLEAETDGPQLDVEPDRFADAVCDWMSAFVGSDEGWKYLSAKRRPSTMPDIPSGDIVIRGDIAHEKGSTTNPKVIEYKDGTVYVGPRKLLATVLAKNIQELLEHEKGEAIQQVVLDVISGKNAQDQVHEKFRKVVEDFLSGRRPRQTNKPEPDGSGTTEPTQTDGKPLADRVWDYMISDDAGKNNTFGSIAKTARNDVDGSYSPMPEGYFDEASAREFIAATIAKERGVSVDELGEDDIGTVTPEDTAAVVTKLKKLEEAINSLTDDEMATDDMTQLGALVTARLTGQQPAQGNPGDQSKKDPTGAGATTRKALVDKFQAWFFGDYPAKVNSREKAIDRVAAMFNHTSLNGDDKFKVSDHVVVDAFVKSRDSFIKSFANCMRKAGLDKINEMTEGNEDFIMGVSQFFKTTLPSRYLKLRKQVQGAIDKYPAAAGEWKDIKRRATVFVDDRVNLGKPKDEKGAVSKAVSSTHDEIARTNKMLGLPTATRLKDLDNL